MAKTKADSVWWPPSSGEQPRRQAGGGGVVLVCCRRSEPPEELFLRRGLSDRLAPRQKCRRISSPPAGVRRARGVLAEDGGDEEEAGPSLLSRPVAGAPSASSSHFLLFLCICGARHFCLRGPEEAGFSRLPRSSGLIGLAAEVTWLLAATRGEILQFPRVLSRYAQAAATGLALRPPLLGHANLLPHQSLSRRATQQPRKSLSEKHLTSSSPPTLSRSFFGSVFALHCFACAAHQGTNTCVRPPPLSSLLSVRALTRRTCFVSKINHVFAF